MHTAYTEDNYDAWWAIYDPEFFYPDELIPYSSAEEAEAAEAEAANEQKRNASMQAGSEYEIWLSIRSDDDLPEYDPPRNYNT